MARKRSMITAAIWSDDWFGPLSYFEQAFWIGLFSTCADAQGRMQDNPVLLRATVFPYKTPNLEEIESALAGFAEAGRIYRYEADGKKLIQIVNWWEHQAPQWASPSEWAAPPGWRDHVRTRANGQYVEIDWCGKRGAGNRLANAGWRPPSEDGGDADVDQVSDQASRSGEAVGCDVQVSVQAKGSPGRSGEDSGERSGCALTLRPQVVGQFPVPVPVPNEDDDDDTRARASPDGGDPAIAEVFRIWGDLWGHVGSYTQVEMIEERIEEYGLEKVLAGMKQCALHNADGPAYLDAILANKGSGTRRPRAPNRAANMAPEVDWLAYQREVEVERDG